MRGIIPATITRLHSKKFTPNMEKRMLEEEDERAFLEWCRQPQTIHLRDDLWPQDKKTWREWIKGLTMFVP